MKYSISNNHYKDNLRGNCGITEVYDVLFYLDTEVESFHSRDIPKELRNTYKKLLKKAYKDFEKEKFDNLPEGERVIMSDKKGGEIYNFVKHMKKWKKVSTTINPETGNRIYLYTRTVPARN